MFVFQAYRKSSGLELVPLYPTIGRQSNDKFVKHKHNYYTHSQQAANTNAVFADVDSQVLQFNFAYCHPDVRYTLWTWAYE